jgi:hypothetical protein
VSVSLKSLAAALEAPVLFGAMLGLKRIRLSDCDCIVRPGY